MAETWRTLPCRARRALHLRPLRQYLTLRLPLHRLRSPMPVPSTWWRDLLLRRGPVKVKVKFKVKCTPRHHLWSLRGRSQTTRGISKWPITSSSKSFHLPNGKHQDSRIRMPTKMAPTDYYYLLLVWHHRDSPVWAYQPSRGCFRSPVTMALSMRPHCLGRVSFPPTSSTALLPPRRLVPHPACPHPHCPNISATHNIRSTSRTSTN